MPGLTAPPLLGGCRLEVFSFPPASPGVWCMSLYRPLKVYVEGRRGVAPMCAGSILVRWRHPTGFSRVAPWSQKFRGGSSWLAAWICTGGIYSILLGKFFLNFFYGQQLWTIQIRGSVPSNHIYYSFWLHPGVFYFSAAVMNIWWVNTNLIHLGKYAI